MVARNRWRVWRLERLWDEHEGAADLMVELERLLARPSICADERCTCRDVCPLGLNTLGR